MAENLIRRLQRGDQTALREIYETYKDDLLTVTACLLADISAAEDVLHDVFVGFASSMTRLNVRSNLKGYLISSVCNRARDRLRSPARRNMDLSHVNEPAAESQDPLGHLIADEGMQRLYRALARLPCEQREVVTLHLHGGMTFREVARTLNVRQSTVQSRYSYSKQKKRSLLQKEGEPCGP